MANTPAVPSKSAWLDPETKSLMDRTIAHERSLSHLLMTYILTGLVFMLLPGTFLGVWNLIAISKQQAAESVAPAWIQAHGHAQLFGWVGTFILGIGFYSVPKLRKLKPLALGKGWLCWGMWSVGVALRWTADVYPWHWRVLLPVSAGLELAAFLLFFQVVSSHRQAGLPGQPWEVWIFAVIAATLGLLVTLTLNLGASIYVASRAEAPAFPPGFDQRFLVISTWGFLVPMVWGFSARWMPVFLGLRPLRSRLLLLALGFNSAGVLAGLSGQMVLAFALLLAGSVSAPLAIRLLEPSERQPKVTGVHPSFPFFVRVAYLWLILAGLLGAWAAAEAHAAGIWGASRHALTVGFIATMVFSVGQRVLPSFCGMRVLFSPRLMFSALALLLLGCTLRVGSEVLAYQHYLARAWDILPISALIELAAVTVFAINMGVTFIRPPIVVQSPFATIAG